MQNIIKHNDELQWTNEHLYKNIISHTLFSKGWWLLWVRDELETGIDCDIDPKFFWPLEHFFLILAGVIQPWVTEGHKPSVCKLILTLVSYLQLTRTAPAPGYIIFLHPPASAVLLLIYTGASLDWLLGRGSIYNKKTTGSKVLIYIWTQPLHL